MASPHAPTLDRRGYTIQFAPLGLPDLDPTSPWAPVRVGFGKKSACQALLLDPSTPAPLRTGDGGDYGIQEIEYEGYIWFLPFFGSAAHADTEEPDIFTVNVRRNPVANMPSSGSASRLRIPEPVQLIYLGPPDEDEDDLADYQPPAQQWPPLPSVKIAFQPGEDSHSDIFDLCLNPTPEQCKAATPEEIESLSNEAINPEWKKETMKAWRRWATFCLEEVDVAWLKSVHREAVRAGLRKTPAEFDRKQAIVRLRAQAGHEGEITALEYALCREETGEVPLGEEWKALPKGAYSEDFVRCTVNLLRKDTGKRLIRREEWGVMRGEKEGEEGAGMEK